MSQLKKYRKVKYLGKGSYGAAILVELRADPSKKFVIKEIVIGHLKPEEQQSAKNEAEVLHQMNHSNITMYIESFVENSKLYIVMEHADGGDLSSAVQKRKTEGKYWAEEELMRIFVQICLALKHVHDQNILHRDLKSQNIFLTQKGMVKLGDFGIAKVLDASEDQARTQIGTPYYLSPEICESQPYGRKSDVWSLGVILYELLALEMPFQAQSLPALVHKIVSQEPNYGQVEGRYSAKLVSLCRTLLQKNSELRPNVAQIVKNDYIKDHISRLLSYTLKAGNGGVLSDIPQRLSSSEVGRLDAEEADRHIERVREKEREQLRVPPESKETQMEREKEKLRKFREDMARKRRDADAKDGGGGRDRSRSPVSSRQGDRSRSPVNRDRTHDTDRARSRSPVNRDRTRGVAPSGGGGGGVSVVVAAPKVNPYQRNAGAAVAGAGGGRSPTAPSAQAQGQQAYRGRSLADIQAQRQQDTYQSGARGGGGGGGGGYMVAAGPSSANPYEDAARREYFASRAAAQAVKAKVEALDRQGSNNHMLSNYDHNGGGGGGGGGAQRRLSNGNGGGSETAAYADMDPERRIAMIKAQRERERQQEIALKEQQMKAAIEQNREERRRFDAMRAQQEGGHGGGGGGDRDRAGGDARRSKGSIAFDIDLRSDDIIVRSSNNAGRPAPSRWSIERDEQPQAQPRRLSNGGGGGGGVVVNVNDGAAPAVANSKVGGGGGGGGGGSVTASASRRGWGPPVEAKDILQAYGRKPTDDGNDGAGDGFEALDDDVTPPSSTKAAGGGGDGHVLAEGEDVVLKRLENKRRSDMAMREQALEVMAKLREKKLRDAKVKKAQQKYGVSASGAADAKQYPVVSPVKKAPVVTAGAAAGVRSGDHRSQSPKLMEVLNSIDAAREFVGNVAANRQQMAAAANGQGAAAGIAAARRMQANVSPVRGSDAKRSRLVEYEDHEEVRRVRALSQPDEDSKRGADVKRGYDDEDDDEGTRMRYGDDDAMEATVNNQQSGPSRSVGDDDLDTSLATWLQEQKRSVTMRKKPGVLTGTSSTVVVAGGEEPSEGEHTQRRERTYMTVDDAAETVRDDEQLAFYASQPRHQRRGAAPDQYEDELFEEYGNMTLEDANTVAYERAGGRGKGGAAGGGGGVSAVSVSASVDDMRGSYDMHRPLRAKFANGEDADVIGMQCMLAQALIDDDLNNGSKYDDDDDDT